MKLKPTHRTHAPSIGPLAGLLGLAPVTGLYAQPPLPARTVTTTADITFIHQFTSDLDDGGDVGMSSAGSKFHLVHRLDGGRSIGWGLGYTADFFSFRIGEYTSVPLFVRASRAITSNLTLNLYGGILLGGSTELENSNGGDLIDSNFDPAPILAFSLSGRF